MEDRDGVLGLSGALCVGCAGKVVLVKNTLDKGKKTHLMSRDTPY